MKKALTYIKITSCAKVIMSLLFILSLSSIITAQQPFNMSDNPWPKIRKERINSLLPVAMKESGIDCWVTLCRENDNDPMAIHVGGENAGGSASFLFFLVNNKVHSIAISPIGESVALKDMNLHDEVVEIARGANVWIEVKNIIQKYNPSKIGINSSHRNITDGLSFTQRMEMEKNLGEELCSKLVSSDPLIVEWLSVKLPQEIEIMRKAALLTEQIQIEAYKSIIPGKTKDSDVGRFIKDRMAQLGVEDGWQPDQNPNVNSGVDRGHSNATEKTIMPGDFIQTDFGIKVYGIWVTDLQRFAYVLKPGQTKPDEEALRKWEIAKRGSRIVKETLKPGIMGYDVDKAQRDWMKLNNSLPVMWSTGHPVGYWAHDVGPSLGGAQNYAGASGSSALKIKPRQIFAYDGFYCWYLDEAKKSTKTISVEEMIYATEEGSQYLIPPQEELFLIK